MTYRLPEVLADQSSLSVWTHDRKHPASGTRRIKVTCQILTGFHTFLCVFRRIRSHSKDRKLITNPYICLTFSYFTTVGWEGLEPSTNALKGRCSTIELPTRNAAQPRRELQPSGAVLRSPAIQVQLRARLHINSQSPGPCKSLPPMHSPSFGDQLFRFSFVGRHSCNSHSAQPRGVCLQCGDLKLADS